jgi:hypothetical protein
MRLLWSKFGFVRRPSFEVFFNNSLKLVDKKSLIKTLLLSIILIFQY